MPLRKEKDLQVKNSPKLRTRQNKLVRILVALLILAALVAAVVFALIFGRKVLFEDNPRLMIREITVQSGGFWQGRAAALAARGGVAAGDALFAVDPAKFRHELMKIPCVENCEIARLLPDTLHIRVTERIPRAILFYPRSPLVVDEKGVAIRRGESMCAGKNLQLPVITGVKQAGCLPGKRLPELEPALEIIMLTVRSFPDIEILAVDLSVRDRLVIYLRYRGERSCKVIFPARSSNYTFLLSALQSAVINAIRRGDTRGTFDLSFEGGVFMR